VLRSSQPIGHLLSRSSLVVVSLSQVSRSTPADKHRDHELSMGARRVFGAILPFCRKRSQAAITCRSRPGSGKPGQPSCGFFISYFSSRSVSSPCGRSDRVLRVSRFTFQPFSCAVCNCSRAESSWPVATKCLSRRAGSECIEVWRVGVLASVIE
jgi:hypothetical protein